MSNSSTGSKLVGMAVTVSRAAKSRARVSAAMGGGR